MKNAKELMKFGITDNLGAWVDENGQTLLEKEILAGETIAAIETYPNVSYISKLKYLSTDALFQAATCGFTTSGNTTLSDKDVYVKNYQVAESLCPQDIKDTSLALSMKAGWNTELPFEGQYMTLKSKEIAKKIESMLWNNASGATEFGGFLEQFDADSDVTKTVFNFTATGITDSQLIAGYYKILNSIPEEALGFDDLTLFLGHDAFRKLNQAFLNTNNVQLTKFDFNGVDYFNFPGFEQVKIKPVHGLNATANTAKRVVVTPASNLLYVCDMVSEQDNSKMFWSDDSQLLKFITRFSVGAAYKFGSYIVVSKTA